MTVTPSRFFPWATAVALVLGTVPATGNGGPPAVRVNVINTAPIAVTVVTPIPPAAPAEVICRFDLGSRTDSAVPYSFNRGSGSGGLLCSPAAIGVNARRVIFDPQGRFPSANFISYQMMLGLSGVTGVPQTMNDATTIVGMFSSGDFEKTLDRPIPITNSISLIYDGSCGGIAGYPITCGGRFWFIGTPIQ